MDGVSRYGKAVAVDFVNLNGGWLCIINYPRHLELEKEQVFTDATH